MVGYLRTGKKEECLGCEACAQICGKNAISIITDDEKFRYPKVDQKLCVHCGKCNLVCPVETPPNRFNEDKYVFGGYCHDERIRFESTSGGAFSVIANVFCDKNYVIFGATADGLNVYHTKVESVKSIKKIRKSKYSQSRIFDSYNEVKKYLSEGKKVLFSGTPCQIAALSNYLRGSNIDNLLTVEVVCEGVPSPLYVEKYKSYLEKNKKASLSEFDYRYKGKAIFGKGKWDFQIQRVILNTERGEKILKKDRWFNPFWSIWLQHLMSRPSCYQCPFTNAKRVADISLGDLWGIHIFCPDLYGENGGTSLVIANSSKGKKYVKLAQKFMYGHCIRFEDAIKYQGPLRKSIDMNTSREEFMKDLKSDMTYEDINRKWSKKPTIKLLIQKYIYGNRQKIFIWKNFKRKRG